MTSNIKKKYTAYTIIIIAALFIINVITSLKLTTHYGGTDLRARIVGARLLCEDRSPYFYKWQQGDNEKLLDPNVNLSRKVNGNVVTPAYLILLQPLSMLPYSAIRIIWTILQYLFIIMLIALMLKYFPAFRPGINWSILLCCLIFLYSDIWVFNLERGQTYSLYALLIGYIVLSGLDTANIAGNIAGFINGIVIFLRPSFAVLIIPFFLKGDYKFCLKFFLGFLIGLIVFVFPFYSLWIDYFKAMQEYGYEIINGPVLMKYIDNLPRIIENMSSLQNFKKEIYVSGMPTIQASLKDLGVVLDSKILILGCAIIILCYSGIFFRLKLYSCNIKIILFSFLLYITVEYFFVGSRGAYALIQWILPVYILLMNRFSVTRFFIIGVAFTQLLIIPSFNFQYSAQVQGMAGEGILYFLCLYDIFIGKSTIKAAAQLFKIKTQ